MPTLSLDVVVQVRQSHGWAPPFEPGGWCARSAAFCEGSHEVSSWKTGSPGHLLAVSGDGRVAEIAENRRHEFISIRRLRMIGHGVEDTVCDAVHSGAPVCETRRRARRLKPVALESPCLTPRFAA